MTIVVCDTGPVLHLYEAELLDWLGVLGTICLPPAVDRELEMLIARWPAVRPPWITLPPSVAPIPPSLQAICRQGGLGHGETEAIALSLELRAEWLLTDDTAARVIAESAGLEVHGSLGIVLYRAGQGEVTHAQAAEALNRLAASSLWVSKPILAKAKDALNQILRCP